MRRVLMVLACVVVFATTYALIYPAITLEKVRGVLAEKSRDGFTVEVREIIQSFGAERLSEIDPANYEAVLKKAEVLGNG